RWLSQIVIALCVLERADQGRGGVKASDAIGKERFNLVCLGKAEDVQLCLGWNGIPDCGQTLLNLWGLERNHSADGQIAIAHCAELFCGGCHAAGRPPLNDTKRRKAVGEMAGRREKLPRVLKGYLEATPCVIRTPLHARDIRLKVEN